MSIAESPADLGPEVIRSQRLSKRFVLRKDKSVKERFVGALRPGTRGRKDFWALRDIDISIRAGETVGLIGHNGSGKSTLLKLIGGILDPSEGTIETRGRLAALLELGAGFHPDLTGRENVYLNAALLGLTREETDERFDDIVAFAEIGEFIDAQVKFYSSGMFVRLAFAVAVHTDPDILLVDEVLAVGDEAFQRKCLDKIREFRSQGVAIVLVTHALPTVEEFCTRAITLDHGRIVHDGDTHTAIREFRALMYGDADDPADDGLRRGTMAGRIIRSVTAHAEGRAPDEAVRPGDRLILSVELDPTVEAGAWACGLTLQDTQGRPVLGVSTLQLSGMQWQPASAEPCTVVFRVDDPPLADGAYFVQASIVLEQPIGVHADDYLDAAVVTIDSGEMNLAIVRAEAAFEIVPG